MADKKKIKDEELANITGAGDALDLGGKKKPPAGGGGGQELPDGEGSGSGEVQDWSTN